MYAHEICSWSSLRSWTTARIQWPLATLKWLQPEREKVRHVVFLPKLSTSIKHVAFSCVLFWLLYTGFLSDSSARAYGSKTAQFGGRIALAGSKTISGPLVNSAAFLCPIVNCAFDRSYCQYGRSRESAHTWRHSYTPQGNMPQVQEKTGALIAWFSW